MIPFSVAYFERTHQYHGALVRFFCRQYSLTSLHPFSNQDPDEPSFFFYLFALTWTIGREGLWEQFRGFIRPHPHRLFALETRRPSAHP